MRRIVSLAAAVLLTTTSALAADITLNGLTEANFEGLIRDLSSQALYTTVSPASSLGKTWGIEGGLIAGASKADELNSLVQQADSTKTKISYIPHAYAFIQGSVPYGITADFAILPKIEKGGVTYKYWAASGKWTITDVFFEKLPLSLATRFHISKSDLTYNQTVSNVPTDVNLENTVWGMQLLASKSFWFVEPYAGIGWTQANGELSLSGTVAPGTFFSGSPAFTASRGASAKPRSFQFLGGANLALGFFIFGLEASHAYKAANYSMKLALRF